METGHAFPSDVSADTVYSAMRAAKSKSEFQRAQCLWLRLTFGLSARDAGRALGWATSTVRNFETRVRREGLRAVRSSGRGGRRHANLDIAREKALLAPFVRYARAGCALNIQGIQAAYERAVGHAVPKSTIYRLLARHRLQHLLQRRISK
jgi:hypothetical protein